MSPLNTTWQSLIAIDDRASKSIATQSAQIPSSFLLDITFSEPLVPVPPLSTCDVCVIVPVKDEAEKLELTLTALANQADAKGQPLRPNRYEIILLANNCSDNSAEIARQFAQQHPQLVLHVVEMTLQPQDAYIGKVRKLLMDEAYRRFALLKRDRGVIASTDGDTQVAPTWIAAILQEIQQGADAVGGRIITDRTERSALGNRARACHLREVGYRFLVAELQSYIDPDPFDLMPRHFQHFGASLAVTAETYGRVGGLPAVRIPEDEMFYRILVRANARVRHSLDVQVITSARQSGRATVGLANQLQQWATMASDQHFLVESAIAVESRFCNQRELKLLWRLIVDGYQPVNPEIEMLAEHLCLPAALLRAELAQSPSLGLLLERLECHQHQTGAWTKQFPLVPVEEAIAALRQRMTHLRQQHQQHVKPAYYHWRSNSTSPTLKAS